MSRSPAMKIRAAVLERFGEPLVVQDVDLAGPGPGEVLVRLAACGVCHTDMYTASGVDPSGYSSCVLGHEGAGVVEAIGEGVSSVANGDHVVTLFSPQCRECVNCRSGKTNICLAIREQQGKGYLPDGTTRLSRDGEELRHFMGCSTFAEAAVMPEIALAKVSPDAKLEAACLFACGLSTGLAGVMRQAVESARMGWGTCCVTGVAGKGETLDIVPRFLITGRKVMGASFGGVKGRDQVPLLVDRYLAGDIDVDSFLSHRITLDEVNRGFDLMHHQDGIRSVIAYS
jgi:Zn-dependent alcohol dehydrogenase